MDYKPYFLYLKLWCHIQAINLYKANCWCTWKTWISAPRQNCSGGVSRCVGWGCQRVLMAHCFWSCYSCCFCNRMPVFTRRRGGEVSDIGSCEYRHSPVTEREYSWIHWRSFHSRVSARRKTCLSAFSFVSQSADLFNSVKLLHSVWARALKVLLRGVGGWNDSPCTRQCFKLSSTKQPDPANLGLCSLFHRAGSCQFPCAV